MATDIERLILEVSASTKGLERGLNALNKKVDRSTSQAERSFQRMNKNILMSSTAMSRDLGNVLAAAGVAYATKEVAAYADAWTNARNKLAAAGTANDRLAATQSNLARIARDTRTEVESTIDLYARMKRSTEDLEVSDIALSRATEIVNKSFKAGGGSIQEQTAAITQLGQALGSGQLQGDELRSIRENAPLLAKAIAEEFNTTAAGLKKLGAEGQLTSDRVFRAIIKSGAEVDKQFATTQASISDSFQNLRTAAIEWIGTQDQALGATQAFAGFMTYATQNFDAFADATIVGATILGGVFAGQAVMAAIRASVQLAGTLGITRAAILAQGASATIAAGGMNALRASMAFLGGPWGIAIAAIATAIGLIYYEANRSVPPTEELAGAISDVDKALQAYETASVAASAASGEARTKAIQEANALRTVAVEASNAAKKKIELARATIAAARAVAAERQQNLADYGGDPGLGTYNRTTPSERGPSASATRQARADLEAGEKALKEQEATLARIDANLNRPLTSGGGAVETEQKGGKGKARSGPTLEELALENKLEVAREQGDANAVRALEDQLDLKKRINDYEDAGQKGVAARTMAEADQNRVLAARAEAMARERANMAQDAQLQAARASGDEDLVRQLDRAIELRELTLDYEDRGLATAEARTAAARDLATIEEGRQKGVAKAVAEAQQELSLQVAELANDIELTRELGRQIELRDLIEDYKSRGLEATAAQAQAESDLARIEAGRMEARRQFWVDEERAQARRMAEAIGDERRQRALDRQAEIKSRSERYRSEGNMPREEAEARAKLEVDAEAIGEVRGKFRDAFKDGWRAALDGDFEDWLSEKAAAGLDKAAERGLEALGDWAFDMLQNAFPSLIDSMAGLGEDATAAATMGTAITTSATTGAAAMGTAVSAATATGSIEFTTAITSAGSLAAIEMGAAITAAGTAAAAAMAAAIASANAASEAGNAIANIAQTVGTAKAGGGHVRAGVTYPVNEFGREGFSPGFNGAIIPADIMAALAALKPGNFKPQATGPMRVIVQNNGEPMEVQSSVTPEGDLLMNFEPMFDRGIEGSARSGRLNKHLKRSPRPERKF